MKTADYFAFIAREIHKTVVATVDEDGLPVTAVIDMMDCDESNLYFLTAKGKLSDSSKEENEYYQSILQKRIGELIGRDETVAEVLRVKKDVLVLEIGVGANTPVLLALSTRGTKKARKMDDFKQETGFGEDVISTGRRCA